MSDIERQVRDWLSPILSETSCGDDEDDADLVASCVSMVGRAAAKARTEERAAVVAWLQTGAAVSLGVADMAVWSLMINIATAIEAGEHEAKETVDG